MSANQPPFRLLGTPPLPSIPLKYITLASFAPLCRSLVPARATSCNPTSPGLTGIRTHKCPDYRSSEYTTTHPVSCPTSPTHLSPPPPLDLWERPCDVAAFIAVCWLSAPHPAEQLLTNTLELGASSNNNRASNLHKSWDYSNNFLPVTKYALLELININKILMALSWTSRECKHRCSYGYHCSCYHGRWKACIAPTAVANNSSTCDWQSKQLQHTQCYNQIEAIKRCWTLILRLITVSVCHVQWRDKIR